MPQGLTTSLKATLLYFPAVVWPRVLVLLLALVCIKLALLVGLHKHLYETHYRVSGHSVTWVNYAAFGLFVFLGTLTLAGFAQQCRALGLKAVRSANAAVLGLGLLFIFLSFHSGRNNYLYPIMTGVLPWSSLVWYLSLDFFFQPPYLAVWLFGYALSYYVLTRTGREIWVLHLTTLCAAAYALFHLRELLVHGNELLIIDILGFLSVTIPHRREPFRFYWLLLPLVWGLFSWFLFRLASPDLAHMNPYFTMLLGDSVVLFGACTLWAWRQGFFRAWTGVALFYFAAFLLLSSRNYPSQGNCNNLLCLALEFPRYFVGESFVAGGVCLVAALLCRLRCHARLWTVDFLNLALIAMALADLRLSQVMEVRLDWDLLSFGNSPAVMWRMARPYLPGAALAFGGIALLYLGVVYGLRSVGNRFQAQVGSAILDRGCWYIVASLFLLGWLGSVVATPDKAQGQACLQLFQTNPLWVRASHRVLTREEFLNAARGLGLGDPSEIPGPTAENAHTALNVLLVFMESSYNQHLSLFGSAEETQPLLSQYRDRMEIFPNFFSNFAGSIHSRFAAFTSLYPVRDYNAFTLKRVGVKSLFEVMHENGYACSMFYSSFFDYTGFRDFLRQRGLDEMYDADNMPGVSASAERVSWGLREEDTLGAIRSRIKKYAAAREQFFLTYVPAAPHYPYDSIPKRFEKFKYKEIGDYTPLYLNELLYMDWVIASVLDELRDCNLLDKTLVIITNDHGEMLGAKGERVGHGWAVTPELANIPLIIMDPRKNGFAINQAIGSQVDLLPTVLGRVGIPVPHSELYQGRSLDSPEARRGRLVYLNSYEQCGVLSDNELRISDRRAEDSNSENGDRQAYELLNQGAKTVFKTKSSPTGPSVSIDRFDAFQESFLRNYSAYRDLFRPTAEPVPFAAAGRP